MDKDALNFEWFHYREPGTSLGQVEIEDQMHAKVQIVMPEVLTPRTVHFVLQVTDTGSPALTRYKRVIVSILPK